jgi:hypothetical protein
MSSAPIPPAPGPRALRRLAPAVGLLFLSPICAEYLIGYGEIIGRPLELLTGLLFFAPLYGTVAVMIREIARRTGRGWPTILLLSAAFGLIQAGLIDQSLFNPDFIDEPSWDRDRLPTLIPGLGVSVKHVLGFIGGHVIWSFGAPIAVCEACVPRLAARPWLGRVGMTTMVVLYALAVLVFFNEHTKTFMASSAQLGVTSLMALALAVAAFAIPRRSASSSGRVPPVWLVGCGAVILLATHQLASPSWLGVALDALSLALLFGLLLWCSGRAGWRRTHVLAVGGAALVVNAGLSFVVEPVGDTSHVLKYAANSVLLLGVLALLASTYRRLHRAEATVGAVG